VRVRSSLGASAFPILTLACSRLQNPSFPVDFSSEGEVGRPVVLNEILFQPQGEQVPFIELKATVPRASLDGLYLINELNQRYALPEGQPSFGPGEFPLIIFDGGAGLEQGVIHASPLDWQKVHMEQGGAE